MALTLAISFLICIYAPLELYFTNVDEFPHDFALMLPELLQGFCVMMAAGLLCFGFCYVLYVRLYDLALVAAAVGYLCTYIQGMFLSGNLPPLDGRKIKWHEFASQNLHSLLLWFLVGVAVVLLIRFLHMKKMRVVFTALSLFLTSVLLVTLVSVGIQYDGFRHKTEAVMTKEDMFTLSQDKNLLIFMVDAADSATFSAMLEDHEEWEEVLTDFTYYPDTVGAYPFTKHSVPFILTGQWFENQEDFDTFTTKAMDASPLISALKAQDYRMGFYEEELVYNSEHVFAIENANTAEYEIVGTKPFLKQQLSLVWFKYAPFPLKQFVKVNMQDFNNLVRLKDNEALFSPNNRDFYEELLSAEVTTVPERCFRFIHIEGAHVPFRYDKDVNLIDEEDGTYEQNMECSMTIVKAYLELLKEAGVYDNSAIIIMADHGYGHNRDIPIVGRGNPLLAVKGIGEDHPFTVSGAPISYEDLQTAYQRLLEGQGGEAVFDAREGDDRDRRFICYFYEKEDFMAEYTQTGHAFDIETMTPTGIEYKTGKKDGPPKKG